MCSRTSPSRVRSAKPACITSPSYGIPVRYCEHKAFQQGATTCRSLDVQFAGDQWAQEDGHPTVDHLKIIQQSLAPIYATVKVGKIGKVHIPLDGGPLIINAAVENDPGVHNSYVLLKVTGSCSTPDGLPA